MELVLTSPSPGTATKRRGGGAQASHVPHHVPHSALREFICTMRAEPAAEFRTEDAAAAFAVSPFVFIRAFKELTGLSPQRYRAALRIELAKRLLVETRRSVTEISFDVGYNSLGTFIRTFTLLVGVSPSQLRRLARGFAPADVLTSTFHGASSQPATGENIEAKLLSKPPTGSLVAAGLFPQAIPAGLPFDGCFIDPRCQTFSLTRPLGRTRASLLVAALESFSIEEAWAGRLGKLLVHSQILPNYLPPSRTITVRLRPLADTDPPFLTPVPLLMLVSVQGHQEQPTPQS